MFLIEIPRKADIFLLHLKNTTSRDLKFLKIKAIALTFESSRKGGLKMSDRRVLFYVEKGGGFF